MLAGGYSWCLFFYVETAFAAALLILAFLFVEESTYHRLGQVSQANSSSHSLRTAAPADKEHPPVQLETVSSASVPRRKSFFATLKPWSAIDPEPDFFMTIARSFTYFSVPAVFWVISTYGQCFCYHEIYKPLILQRRTVYRPRGIGIQLYLPTENHGATVQLEPCKHWQHSPPLLIQCSHKSRQIPA